MIPAWMSTNQQNTKEDFAIPIAASRQQHNCQILAGTQHRIRITKLLHDRLWTATPTSLLAHLESPSPQWALRLS